MNKYTFGVWLDIDAEDESQALSIFNAVVKENNLISDSYCFDWKEVESE